MSVLSEMQVEELTLHQINEMTKLHCFVRETMRIDPATQNSVPYAAQQDIVIRGVRIPKGTDLTLSLRAVLQHSKEWTRPHDFLPERFDMDSPLYKRPDGEPRSSIAFAPFSSGPRNCPGQVLALA